MRNLGICLGGANTLTTDDRIKIISEVGFNCFFAGRQEDFLSGKISELAAKYNLDFECIHAPFKGFLNDIWDTSSSSVGDDALKILLDTADECNRFGVRKMVVHLSSGEKAPIVNDMGINRFSHLVEHASEMGITIAFENQRKIGNLAVMLEKYKDNPFVGFCFDTGHQYCFTPGCDYMGMFGKRLTYTHIHDNMGIYNKDQHMLPFDGVADFHKIARDMNNAGYKGSLVLEVIQAKSGFYDDIPAEKFIEMAYERATRLRKLVDGE